MIQPVDDQSFQASASAEPARLLLTFAGSTEIDTKPLLDRFLKQVHEEACQQGVEEVTADLREAAFVNSACLKALASWVMMAAGQNQRIYRITFLTAKSHAWQRRSLAAITSLAPHAISVVPEA